MHAVKTIQRTDKDIAFRNATKEQRPLALWPQDFPLFLDQGPQDVLPRVHHTCDKLVAIRELIHSHDANRNKLSQKLQDLAAEFDYGVRFGITAVGPDYIEITVWDEAV